MSEDEALAAFGALSGSMRLRVVKLLIEVGEAGLTAGEISDAMDASPSKMSFHLSTLSKAGLVTSQKNERQITYRADFTAIGKLVQYILVDCCSNHPSVLSCCAGGDGC